MTHSTSNGLYSFLERLKTVKLLSIRDLTGDEITMAEKLVEMRLATKVSTKVTTFYFYGVEG